MALFDFFRKEPKNKNFQENKNISSAQLLKEIASLRSYDLETSLIDGYNPDKFIERKDYTTIDEMMSDESVYSVLEMKKSFLLSTGYHFTIAKNEDNKNDDLINFVKDNFETKYEGLFQNDLYQILSAYEYGFSLSEKVFKKLEDKIYLTRLKTVPPHSIDFYTDDMGKLDKIIQKQINATPELPIAKMLLFVQNSRFDSPYGISDLKRCYRAWFSKKMIIRFWNIYLERYCSPVVIAKVPNQFGTNKVNELSDILDSIQQKASIIVPEDANLNFEKTGNSSGEYNLAIEKYNSMISRALLMPDLLGMGAETKGGSYALGQKHYEMFIIAIQKDRKKLEELINENCIKPLIDYNFGPQEVYPRFEFLPFENEQFKDIIELFLSSVDKGMPIVDEDWNHLRKSIKFPTIDFEDLDNLEPLPKQEEQKPNIERSKIEPKQVEGTEIKEQEKIKEKDMSFMNDLNIKELNREIIAYRTPDKYEKRIDFIKEAETIQKLENKTINRLADKFEDIKEALKMTIKRKGILNDGMKIDQIPKLRLKFLGDLETMLRRDLKTVYSFGRLEGKREIKELKAQQADQLADLKEEQFAVKITDEALKPSLAIELATKQLEAETFQAIGNINDELMKKVRQILLTGLETGLSEKEIYQQIDNAFNSVVKGASTGDLAYKPWRVITTIRTLYNKFYSLGRRQVGSEDPFIKMYEYSAILDPRTTELCISLDQKMYNTSDPIWSQITPPNHFNALVEGTFIKTKNGKTRIENVKVGDLVMTHTGVYKPVYDTMNKFEDKEYFEIELEDGKIIKITGEHPILTNRGWIRADELTLKDDIKTVEDARSIICPICNKVFIKKYENQKFCSAKCNCINENNKKRLIKEQNKVQKKCLICKKVFKTDRVEQIYCSIKCKHKSMEKNNFPELFCKHCGKEIKVILRRKGKTQNKVFCSKQCNIDYMIKNRRKQYCLKCREEIYAGYNGQRFCSFSCYRKYTGESSIEKVVRKYLEELGVKFETEVQFKAYAVDFLLPLLDIIIEVDGDYWHSIEKTVISDRRKDNFLRNKGYEVIRLKEYEIKENKFKAKLNAFIKEVKNGAN